MSEQPLCLHGTPHRYVPSEEPTPDLAAVAQKMRENMNEKYDLVYIAYDETLRDEQVEVLLSGENPWEHNAFDMLQESEAEQRRTYSDDAIRDVLDDEEYAVLDGTDEYFELVQEIQDRDESDWFTQLLGNTHSMLLRYRFDVDRVDSSWNDTDDERTDLADNLADQLGIAPEHRERFTRYVIDTLPEVTYGGHATLLMYDHPQRWYDATMHVVNGRRVTVTVTDFMLLFHDGMNGSGMDVKIEGIPLTFQYDPANMHVDTQGPGYSWTSVAGPYPPAFDIGRVEFTVTTPVDLIKH